MCATTLNVFLGNIQIFKIYGQWQSDRTRFVMLCGHFWTFSVQRTVDKPNYLCTSGNTAHRLSLNHFPTQDWRTYRMRAQNDTGHLLLSQFSLISLADRRLYKVKNTCIYTHIWMRRHLIRITIVTTWHCKWKILTQIGSGVKCWLDIYNWGAGLTVTGRIRDVGQNGLKSSFQTGNSNSPSYCHIFFLITFLKDFIKI